jgi:TusA-related sulfurtransferase
MTKKLIKKDIYEDIKGRDLYKLYYDETLSENEREAILKRLDEADKIHDYRFTETISKYKNAEKVWEYEFENKLNPLDKEELMEIKKGERLWLYAIDNMIVRAINKYYWSNGNSVLLDYPEYVPTDENPNPLIELINMISNLRKKVAEVENWLTEHGWVKRYDITSDMKEG